MKKTDYSWNETLRFSWGHIIAFVALIFICYISYMGDFYKNGGNFILSGIKTFFIAVLLFTVFIGAQICKATERKFSRRIIWERLLVCLCPIVFVCAMVPYNNFWAISGQHREVTVKFNAAIADSKALFDEYERYAEKRIENYSRLMETTESDSTRRESYIQTLRLQLLSQNTDNLKKSAIDWIDETNQGANEWNVFLVGNIKKIKEAIMEWNNTLKEYSTPILSNEETIEAFGTDRNASDNAVEELDTLLGIYSANHGLNYTTILTGIILFFMLFLPYLLQSRNTKAVGFYHLIPIIRSRKAGTEVDEEEDHPFGTGPESPPRPKAGHGKKEEAEKAPDNDPFSGTF